jgi:hypothetical protein
MMNEWVRQQLVDVVMTPEGTAVMLISRVLKGLESNGFNYIDAKVGPDGHWYTLEYTDGGRPVSNHAVLSLSTTGTR